MARQKRYTIHSTRRRRRRKNHLTRRPTRLDQLQPELRVEHIRVKQASHPTATAESRQHSTSWKLQYTYLKTGVCYTFDPASLAEYRACKEPWKYELSVRLVTTSGKDVALSGFLHQQNTFTSGMPNTFMLRSGKIHMITAVQKKFQALPRPYETKCSYYAEISRRMNYTDEVIQSEECSERCLSNKWKQACSCYPKLYGARDRLNGSLCEYLSHLRCIQEMKDQGWLPLCQDACTRACYEIRYGTLSFTIGNIENYMRSDEETIVNVRMGSTRAEITSNVPRLTGSDMFTLLSGHVSMWLGISATMLFSLVKRCQSQVENKKAVNRVSK